MATMKARAGWYGTRKRADRGGKYQARWADENGDLKSEFFLTKEQARKYASDMAKAVLDGMVGLAPRQKAIQEAADSFLGRSLDPKTTALNERRINDFLASLPAIAQALKWPVIRDVAQLQGEVIHEYDKILIARGCNPGGRQHVLKIVRAFCRYCMEKKWLGENPFKGFKMPTSQFEGRLVTPEEFERLCSRGWKGGNQHSDSTWQGGTNQHSEVDHWLEKALRFGRETMLRISQVWELKPECFREPDQLWIRGIKGQDGVWITLRPAAVAILRELGEGLEPGQRYFHYWTSVESMRTSVHDKAVRVGLKGIRFHDACKVSRVSELDALGVGLGKLSELSNTSKKTLSAHYVKADRKRAFDEYARLDVGRVWAESGPKNGTNGGNNAQQSPMVATTATLQNDTTSPQNPSL